MNHNETGQPVPPEESVDLEDIAALADGRLDGAERQRVVERLAADEESYELFKEVLRLQEEEDLRPGLVEQEVEEETDDRDVVVPIDRRLTAPTWRRWAPAAGMAAAAMLAVVVVGLLMQGALPRVPTDARYLTAGSFEVASEPQTSLLTKDWYLAVRKTSRGFVSPADERLEFQLGVEIVGLHIALTTQNLDQAKTGGERLVSLLKIHSWALMLVPGAEDWSVKLAGPDTVEGFEQVALVLEEDLEEGLESLYLDYGRWVEAGRLAAVFGHGGFFGSSGTRELLRRLERAGLEEDVDSLRALIIKDGEYDFVGIDRLLVRVARRRGVTL